MNENLVLCIIPLLMFGTLVVWMMLSPHIDYRRSTSPDERALVEAYIQAVTLFGIDAIECPLDKSSYTFTYNHQRIIDADYEFKRRLEIADAPRKLDELRRQMMVKLAE